MHVMLLGDKNEQNLAGVPSETTIISESKPYIILVLPNIRFIGIYCQFLLAG